MKKKVMLRSRCTREIIDTSGIARMIHSNMKCTLYFSRAGIPCPQIPFTLPEILFQCFNSNMEFGDRFVVKESFVFNLFFSLQSQYLEQNSTPLRFVYYTLSHIEPMMMSYENKINQTVPLSMLFINLCFCKEPREGEGRGCFRTAV